MGLGTCGLYVPFGKKKTSVGHEHLSPNPRKYVSDSFESSPSHSNTNMLCSKSPSDRNLVTEKEFCHRRSSSVGNIHKPPRNILTSGRSSDASQAVKWASQADRDLVTEKKFHHQRSFSQGNCYENPQNNLVPRRASDANQAAKQCLSSTRCQYYGHGNIIKGLNSVTKPQDPESVEEINNLGNMKYRNGYFKEAISLYDKAIALCPQNAAFHSNKAAAFISLGRLTEAVEECLKAIKCEPSCSRAHYRLGTLYTRFGQVDNASWHFELSGKNIGSEIRQRLSRIEAHYVNTNKAKKVKDWDGVLRESTLCIEAGVDASNQLVALKAEALFKLRRVDEAFELVNAASHSEESRVTKPCKGTACLLIIETKLNLYLGRFEKGFKSAERAVDMDSTRKSLNWLKKARGAADARKCGNSFYKDQKYLEACTMFGHGLQYVPTNNVLLCDRAACRSKLGQWEMAIDDCNAALRERPNFHKALLWRAHSYAKLRRWEDSLKDYSALSKEFPGDEFIASSLDQVQMELKAQTGRFSSLEPIVETNGIEGSSW
ncbi:putative tetratricopeptide-like helical domain-containing protein [Rosa chinensis]|uniref:Putative tetratricopeptide-like helical domain-containing protein n=1 Tax=Rosa chinensis TaxID=74649 RepID=A0A2P6R591_ROSCH|nr:TPR repeat-containing thioredoxin TTL4 [Rosa chinensis]PRQ41602.1 putative tetratricopeptide-like helical domain-containing protein [Rosa chinensis]